MSSAVPTPPPGRITELKRRRPALALALFVVAVTACNRNAPSRQLSSSQSLTAQTSGPLAATPAAPADSRGADFEPAATCVASREAEALCGDANDDDCDGLFDCADPDCASKSCGNGLRCSENACTGAALKTLPPLARLSAFVDHDNVFLRFLPHAGAKDYRVFELEDPRAVTQNADGSISVKGAVYRCAGARPLPKFDASSAGEIWGYERKETESLLGYAYAQAAPDRVPVFALGHPGAEFEDRYGTGSFTQTRLHVYVAGERERAALVARGYRDDGVVFYVPRTGDRTVHFLLSGPQAWVQDRRFGLLFNDGPEQQARAKQGSSRPLFKLLGQRKPGALPVYRVHYPTQAMHDELALGEGSRDRLLKQGNQPANLLSWSALRGPTTLVVEALDRSCPFGGLLAAKEAAADGHAKKVVGLKQARAANAGGEVYVNGQLDQGRPRPIARSFVTVEPSTAPRMDVYYDFSSSGVNQEYALVDHDDGVGSFHLRSELFNLDFFNVEYGARSIGEALGQLWVAYADVAADTNGKFRLAPRRMAKLADDRYLHVTARMDIPSTMRRYPQLLVSTLEPPIQRSLEKGATVIVQPFASTTHLQIQVCKERGWDVNDQCPQAVLYWPPEGNPELRWPPQPVAAERSAFDYLPRFDLFLSTSRVYVYFEGRPYGCGVLPAGTWKAGPVSVNLGDVLYHSGVDESVACDDCPHEYLKRHSLTQTIRKFDSFGFSSGVALPGAGHVLPAWDEQVMPCFSGKWEVL